MKELIQTPIFRIIIGYVVIGLFSISPIIIAVIASYIGKCLGCNINEAGTDDCVRFGIPFGNILNPLAVMGWLFLITVPMGLIAFIYWTFQSFKILFYK